MDYKALELKLRRIVEKRLEEGWLVSTMDATGYVAFARDGMCCAIGAAALEAHDIPGWNEAESVLGLNFDQIKSIERGFEDRHESELNEELFDLGTRIRSIYVDDNGKVE